MVRATRKKIMPNTPFLRCHRAAHRSRITANMYRYITHDHPLLIMGSSVLTFPSPALAEEAGGTLRPLAGFWFLNASTITPTIRRRIVSVPLRGSPILASPVATGKVASTASRWGRLCLACTSVAMEGLQLASMAPPPAHCVCHLPRSGRGGWRCAPSPCGVLVLKSSTSNMARKLMTFPSPCGGPYLSFPRRYGGSGEQCEPMGALVPCVHF